MLLQSTLQAAR